MADDGKIVIAGPISLPPIETGNSNNNEEKPPPPQLPEVGGLQPPAADVAPPELTFSETWEDDKDGRWQSGPTISVEKPPPYNDPKAASEKPTDIPYVHAFTINTGNVVDTVKLAIGDLKTAVTAYNTHKEYVSSREGWIFSVATKEDIGTDGDPFTNVTSETYNVTPGTDEWALRDVDSYAGPSRELVEQLNTYQHKLMMSASDVITLVSQFTLAVDGAAQAYAQIDYSSQFPDAPTITEVTMSNDGTITQ